MKRIIVISLLLVVAPVLLMGHAGEVHTYLGTIKEINKDGSFVLRMTDGKERTVLVSKSTIYTHADGHKGKQSELAVGKRIAVKIKDGKTAMNVKFSAVKKAKK